jgi:phage terminase small subunit
MKLTPKQERFCEEYLIDLNATQAAIRAGYSKNTAMEQGYQLLHKTSVQGKITELRATVSNNLNISAEWVITRLKEISDRCVQAEPVMMRAADGSLVESGEYKFDSSGANKATELIGRHLGIFEADNKQKSSVINVNLTDE